MVISPEGVKLQQDWISIAEELRGLAWVGTLDPIVEAEILEAMVRALIIADCTLMCDYECARSAI